MVGPSCSHLLMPATKLTAPIAKFIDFLNLLTCDTLVRDPPIVTLPHAVDSRSIINHALSLLHVRIHGYSLTGLNTQK